MTQPHEIVSAEYGTLDRAKRGSLTFRDRTNIVAFLCLCTFLDGVDLQLLPSSFRGLEQFLAWSPSDLALLATCQGVAQIFAGPTWGIIADHGVSRRALASAGMAAWGLLTLMLAGVSSLPHAMFLRAFNGVALGMVTPVMQSVIVDIASPEDRGKLFGLALFCNSLGQTVCSLLATQLSTHLLWNVAGWRVAFLAVGVLSLTVAVTLNLFMVEAPRHVTPSNIDIKEELRMFGRYWRLSSFKVIVFQGVFGMVPANVLVFLIMYFQYVGFSNAHAAMFFMAYIFCHGAGSFLGGFIGDYLAQLSPDHGRAVTAQISVISGLPLVWAVTHGIHRTTENAHWYALCLICLGLCSSWCGAGVNAPLLSEVVSRQHVARIYAWNIALQQSFALTLGATGTAFLAQRVFGYESSSEKMRDMSPATKEANAAALGEAMAWLTVVPWMACFLFYTSLHFVYPADKRQVSEQRERLPATEQARAAF